MKKITFEDVISKSIPHGFPDGGKRCIFETSDNIISIVGGRVGLYGDFDRTFEVAIIDKTTNNFVSKKYFPEYSDSIGEIMPYITREEMLEVVNKMLLL